MWEVVGLDKESGKNTNFGVKQSQGEFMFFHSLVKGLYEKCIYSAESIMPIHVSAQ